MLILTLLAACSVKTPRDGFTAAARLEDTGTAAPGPGGESNPPPTDSTTGTTAGPGSETTVPSGAQPQPQAPGDRPPAAAAVPGRNGVTATTRAAGSASPRQEPAGATTAPPSAAGSPAPGPSPSGPAPGKPNQAPAPPPPAPRDAAPGVGVTDQSITISFMAGFGGPYGPVIEGVYSGFQTWLDDINARGGILGRKVIAKKVDHKETADGGVAACKEVLSNGSFTAIIGEGQGDANVTAANCLNKAGFLHFAFVGAPDPDWTHTYTVITSSVDQGRSLASFVKNKLGDGGKKLGVMYIGQPVYTVGKDAYVARAKELGLNIVAQERLETNQATFTAQLLRMRDAGVENIAIMATIEAVGILRDARALGYEPHFTGIVWLFDFITQAARDTARGASGLRYNATIDSPAFARYRDTARKYGHSSGLDGEAFLFFGYGLLFEEVLGRTGKVPNAESLRSAIESMRNYDNGIMAPITWGPGDRIGPTASFPSICCSPDWTWKSMGPAREDF